MQFEHGESWVNRKNKQQQQYKYIYISTSWKEHDVGELWTGETLIFIKAITTLTALYKKIFWVGNEKEIRKKEKKKLSSS